MNVSVPAPELSIVLPVYNEGEAVEPVLRSLSAAVTTPHELLVVYDFDEDTTVPVVTRLASEVPGLRGVRNDLGRGVLRAMKAGIAASAAPYVLVSMADGSVRVDAGVSFQDGELAPYGIRFGNLVFRPESGVLVGMADVVVTDDGNEYVGFGGASAPAPTCRDTASGAACPNACRISNIMLTQSDAGSVLSGSVYCEGLYLRLDPMRERELTNSANPAEPAFFEIDNCNGF